MDRQLHGSQNSKACQDQKDAIRIFKQCQETTAVPGLIGTLRNNQQIDLALESDCEQSDIGIRMAMLEVLGILYAGYIPHSNEVGRVRAVCDSVFSWMQNV